MQKRGVDAPFNTASQKMIPTPRPIPPSCSFYSEGNATRPFCELLSVDEGEAFLHQAGKAGSGFESFLLGSRANCAVVRRHLPPPPSAFVPAHTIAMPSGNAGGAA